ncbi:MAG: hypothetical protein K0Q49_2418 [Haloplasmataceae bacterium]|nr:hypothetical protein [Haloplasmataceae bacterium]
MFKKSLGLRLLAYIIDYILIFVIAGILYYLFDFGTLKTEGFSFEYSMNFIELAIVSLIYYMPFAFFASGNTTGKMCTGITIRKPDLSLVDKKTILFRELIKAVLNWVGIISFIFVLFRSDRKSIHDLLVDTIVVRRVNTNELMKEKQEEQK